MKTSKKDGNFKILNIPITLGSLIASAISGIIGYIAVYFFKPIWEKLVRWWNK